MSTERIEQALRAILEIGKRDMSNPKYDGYFEEAREALDAPVEQPLRERVELPCPICGKELSHGISWCKTCDVVHAVRCVECHPCGYISTGPCELNKRVDEQGALRAKILRIDKAIKDMKGTQWENPQFPYTPNRENWDALVDCALATPPAGKGAKTPGEDAWLEELEQTIQYGQGASRRDKMRTILRAYRANLLNTKQYLEKLPEANASTAPEGGKGGEKRD